MFELYGILAAILSSGIGGTAIGATRYLAGTVDPLAIGAFRFGIGFALMLPLMFLRGTKWPAPMDWPAVAGLGCLFFVAFPLLFNASLIYTTAARGALALSTLPLLTMVTGAVLGSEPLSVRKTVGVLIAMGGVGLALLSGLTAAPLGAWRGDLLMIAAAFCMALYSIWSKAVMRRSGPVAFTTMAMGVGAVVLVIVACARGSFAPVSAFTSAQWFATIYLGAMGSALIFYLWAFALERTTPTRVAVSVTVNPITASLVGAIILGEPLSWNLMAGIVAVFIGIYVATSS